MLATQALNISLATELYKQTLPWRPASYKVCLFIVAPLLMI
jgi:hypothetical protein